jgi:hypothetical protein
MLKSNTRIVYYASYYIHQAHVVGCIPVQGKRESVFYLTTLSVARITLMERY